MSSNEEKEFDPELYDEQQLDAVDKHIVQYFGEYKNVFHEIFSPDIHVDICIIEPDEDRDFYTLVTMGMGAHKMNVPEKLVGQGLERAELVICLPPDWDLSSCEEKDYWPIRLLKGIARLPIASDTWIGWGHSVDNGGPFAENTGLCGTLILSPPFGDDCGVCVMPDGEEVNFYQLIPIHRDEMEYKIENGTDALLDMFGGNLSPAVDPGRESEVICVDRMIVDTYEWHVGSIREKNLPVDEITGYNHMAIYLRWAIEKDLMCEEFLDYYSDTVKAVRSGENTDLREFIRDELEGRLLGDMFSEEGERFAAFYYNHANDDDQPCYPCDVDDHALKYFGEERYNSDEFCDEAYLFVPFDEDYYNAMREYIEHYYAEFTRSE